MANGGVGGGIGGSIGTIVNLARNLKGGKREAREALDVLRNVQEPNFDFTRLTPPQLELVARIAPVVFQANVPDEVKLANPSATREAQRRALGQFEEIGREGLPLADQLAAQTAAQAVATEQRRAQEAIIGNLGQRGRLGAGQESQIRLRASQALGQQSADIGRSLAAEAVNRRFAGTAAAAETAGQLAGAEERFSESQADRVNRFNELVAQLQTQATAQSAANRQQANVLNAQSAQRISETNRLLPFQTAREERDTFNTLQAQLANFRAGRAADLSAGLRKQASRKDAERAAEEEGIVRIGAGIGQAAGTAAGGGAGEAAGGG